MDRASKAKQSYSFRGTTRLTDYQEPEIKMLVVFPKPLLKLIIEPKADATGLTSTEKLTLSTAWSSIKHRLRVHAVEIFLNIFTEHHELLEKFCEQNGKFNLNSPNTHAVSVFQIYERLIEAADLHLIMTTMRAWA